MQHHISGSSFLESRPELQRETIALVLAVLQRGCLLGGDPGVHLHSDSLLHRQLSPWFWELKDQCLHEEHSVHLQAHQLLPHFTDKCYWPFCMAHTQSHVAPASQTSITSHVRCPTWVHQPATCPRVSLPSRNSQGNGTLPQRRSEYNLVCAHLSGGRKANNHAGLADKEQLCYMNKHRSAEQDLRHMDRFRTTLKLAWCYVSATNKTHPCSKTSLLSCCHG